MPSLPDVGAADGSLRRFAPALRVGGIAGCVLVLLIAVAGLTGGLDEVAAEGPPQISAGEVVIGAPWSVRVTGAGLFDADPAEPIRPRRDGNHWLVVSADVEVTAPATRRDIDRVLTVTGLDGLGSGRSGTDLFTGVELPDDIRLARDGSRVHSLHPGLPERVLFFWERSADAAPAPADIEVVVVGMTLRESTITRYQEWLDPVPIARVPVPLQEHRDAGGGRAEG